MKKIVIFLCSALIAIICGSAFGTTPTQNSYLAVMSRVCNVEEPPEEEYDKGHRKPGKHIECLIDRNAGVQFCNGATPQFLSYDVYDMDETLVATFLTESEFITYIFSHGGDCQIRLVAAECAYIGYLTL